MCVAGLPPPGTRPQLSLGSISCRSSVVSDWWPSRWEPLASWVASLRSRPGTPTSPTRSSSTRSSSTRSSSTRSSPTRSPTRRRQHRRRRRRLLLWRRLPRHPRSRLEASLLPSLVSRRNQTEHVGRRHPLSEVHLRRRSRSPARRAYSRQVPVGCDVWL